MEGEIWVLAEHREGRLRDVTLEMLSMASRLAEGSAGTTVAVLLGSGVDAMAATLANHADHVLYGENTEFGHFASERYLHVLTDLCRERKPGLIMIAHSAQGADLAPALAVDARLTLTTDVVGASSGPDGLTITRQMFQGRVAADYVLRAGRAHLLTVREGGFVPAERGQPGTVEKFVVRDHGDDGCKRFVEYLEAEAGEIDITKSSVLVAVGRGIKEKKNLAIIEELASVLNADVCGSRVAIDAGWLPQERQVGITGKVVKPDVYIAIGISGSSQHLAGMSGARTVVAINKDRSAPIFSVADFAIVDDLFKVVPKLTEKIRALRGQAR